MPSGVCLYQHFIRITVIRNNTQAFLPRILFRKLQNKQKFVPARRFS
jgi:hypothetical protein